MSTLRDSLSVDPPVIQTAAFRFGAIELAAIDDKIRACEEHLVRSLIRGAVAPNYLVRASSPNESLLTKGAAVCCAGTANPLEIDAATDANLVAQSGRIVGLLLADTGLGNYAAVVVAGVVPGALTGLGTGAAGPVYVDGTTARLTRTSTSYQVGTTDAVGNVILGSAAGGGGGSVVFSGDIAGNAFAQSVRGFYGKALAAAATVTGQTYVYNGTGFELQVATATPTANAIVKADGTAKLASGWLTFGTTSGTVCQGNDSRLSDSRTPTSHATSHKHGGADEIATATAAANAIPKAGAGGTLAVNWLPTGTSSATVCIGNDVRVPASNPSSATAGQCVMSNGSRVVYRGDVGRWWRLSTAHTTTALSTDTIEAFNAAISMGQPVRILDMTGIYTQTVADLGGDASPVVKSGASITGVTGLVLDGKGALHFKLVLVSGSTYRFDIYNDVECLTASLVGHTAGFVCTSTGDQTVAITADNASGLGGNLVITTNGSAKLGIRRIQYLRTGIVTGYNKEDGQLSFDGQLVTTNAGAITEIWVGAPELVVVIHGQIVGPYAPETINTALLSRNADSLVWPFGPATLVHIHAKHLVADTGATQPKLIPVINGNALVLDENASTMTTNFESLTTNAKPQACVIGFGDSIELRSVAGTNLNARNAIFDIIGVLD